MTKYLVSIEFSTHENLAIEAENSAEATAIAMKLFHQRRPEEIDLVDVCHWEDVPEDFPLTRRAVIHRQRFADTDHEILDDEWWLCPNCGQGVSGKYCSGCGTELDWTNQTLEVE